MTRNAGFDRNWTVASALRKAVNLAGIRVRLVPRDALGLSPFVDMRRLASDARSPLIIDAGGNIGQSVTRFKGTFPFSEIHSFEPSPAAYVQLQESVRRYSDVYTINAGLGSMPGSALLLENEFSEMSSILRPGRLAWGQLTRETQIDMQTLDDYCLHTSLSKVEILKIDTQGFDLEVVKGASSLLREHRIHMIFLEIIFGQMYESLPPSHEVLRYLTDAGMKLVSFYEFHFQEGFASWTDALFIDPSYPEHRPYRLEH